MMKKIASNAFKMTFASVIKRLQAAERSLMSGFYRAFPNMAWLHLRRITNDLEKKNTRKMLHVFKLK